MGTYRSLKSVLIVWLALLAVAATAAETAPITPFIGAYEGTTLAAEGEIKSRDLSVVIRSFDGDGFEVRWRTLIFKPGDELKGRSQVIYFRPLADRPGLFVATAPQVAAGAASDQPLDGRPFAWAGIGDRTLTVNVLTAGDDGGYVMQSYRRTLTGTGLVLTFTRVHDGRLEKSVRGEMERVED